MATAKVITIQNNNGMRVTLVDVGASVQFIQLPFDSVKDKSVTLGFSDAEEYWRNPASLGVTVGRYSNRIANAAFSLDGQVFSLVANEGNHQLHGGLDNFGHKRWSIVEHLENKATFRLVSLDGEQGFPGELEVLVTYELDCRNSLKISYAATTTKPTVVNLTDHSYFNLNGMDIQEGIATSAVHDHALVINADEVTEVDEACIPTGRLLSVENSHFDFRSKKQLIELADSEGIVHLDNNFVVNSSSDWQQQAIAQLTCEASGVSLEVYSTKPGVQAYAAQHLTEPFFPNAGLCLETQFFPDSPNQKHFPSCVLRPNETYFHETIYRFSAI